MPTPPSPPIEIPSSALEYKFIRSSGPGGQNVNKVASAVQLRLNLDAWPQLDERIKRRLRTLAGRRLTDDDEIIIAAQQFRTQEQNKRDALERLSELVQKASIIPKTRRATKPTRASKERRLQGKQRRSDVKQARGKVTDE